MDERTMFLGIGCRSWKSWFADSAAAPCNSCLGCRYLPVRLPRGWQLW